MASPHETWAKKVLHDPNLSRGQVIELLGPFLQKQIFSLQKKMYFY